MIVRQVSVALAVVFFLVTSIANADERKFEACRNKLKQAQKLDVLYDLDMKSGREPKVIVGRTFFNMPIDAKEGFTETVNCFLMAGKNQCINFNVLHWQTGKAVGRFSNCKFKMN